MFLVKSIGEAAVLFSLNPIAYQLAAIAQLGERQTEDLKVPGSIPGEGTFFQPFKCALASFKSFVRAPGIQTKVSA